jgi:hypothetical protein
MMRMDLVGRWIDERCIRDVSSSVTTKRLYVDYSEWARREVGFAVSAIALGLGERQQVDAPPDAHRE